MQIDDLKRKELELFKERHSLIELEFNAGLPAKQLLGEKLKREFVEFYSNQEFILKEDEKLKIIFANGKDYSVELRDIGEEDIEFNIFFRKNNSDLISNMYGQYIIVEGSKESRLNLTYRGYSIEDNIEYLGNEKGDSVEALETLIGELQHDIFLLKNFNTEKVKLVYTISDRAGFASERNHVNAHEVLKTLNDKFLGLITL